MLTKKEKQMIRYLNQYKDSFVTSKELATHLQCSDRTIRTYYKTLVEKLEDYEGINVGTSKNTSRASRASNLSLIYSLFLVNFCL